jgi:hypothetical protein
MVMMMTIIIMVIMMMMMVMMMMMAIGPYQSETSTPQTSIAQGQVQSFTTSGPSLPNQCGSKWGTSK